FGQAFPTAFGVDGGYPANTAMYKMLRRADVEQWFALGEVPTDISKLKGELEYLPPKFETQEMPNDVFEHTWSGGGGYGDPLDRDPQKVLVEVFNDAVSLAAAESVYGVIVKDRAVDRRETERRRAQIRSWRLGGAQVKALSKSQLANGVKRISKHLVLGPDEN